MLSLVLGRMGAGATQNSLPEIFVVAPTLLVGLKGNLPFTIDSEFQAVWPTSRTSTRYPCTLDGASRVCGSADAIMQQINLIVEPDRNLLVVRSDLDSSVCSWGHLALSRVAASMVVG